MDIEFLVYIAIGTGVGWIVGTIIFALWLGKKNVKLTLHKLSKDKVNEEGLFWLVAVRDTVDWKRSWGEIETNHIKNKYPEKVIKKGEVVYGEVFGSKEDKIAILFENIFIVNYNPDDFRELTPKEKRKYLK